MDKSMGFDVDHKHTVACILQAGRPDGYSKLKTEVSVLRAWLQTQRCPGDRLRLTFEGSESSGLPF